MGVDARTLENQASLMKKVLCLITALIALSSCEKHSAKLEVPPAMPEQGLEKFSVSETRQGKPNWVLEAVSAQILEKEKRVLMQKPEIKFYQEGAYSSTLTAKKGRINTANYDIWADGDCELKTVKGETLTTSNMVYTSSTSKVSTNEFVRIVRPDEIIEGIGMEASPNLEDITIRKQRVVMKDDKKTTD
jgi:LPS export ABC transporter protein LptC